MGHDPSLTLAPQSISLDSERGFLGKLSSGHNYSIVDLASDQLLGSAGLVDIDHLNQTAEIGIFLGNKDFWGRGYGREALSLLVDYSYQKLNLHHLMLRVYSFNERAIRCYRAVGFRPVGKLREALVRNRKKHDIVLMDLLPKDFYAKRAR